MQYENRLLNRDNEMGLETVSLLGVSPFINFCSSPRSTLALSAVSQSLVLKSNPKKHGKGKRILTGIEQELAKYTLAVRAPCDMTILKIIEQYPKNMGSESIKENPLLLVIYEDDDTGEVNCFDIPLFASTHQYFGYDLIPREAYHKLSRGASFKKGTVFVDTPAVDSETGIYENGISLNFAFMTEPSASEDGIIVNEDILPLLSFKVYEKRVIDFGGGYFALNLYGDTENYKPIPEIGDTVRSDGLLMALRQYDVDNFASDTDIFSTTEVDHIFDKTIYARDHGGKIIDIKVVTDDLDCVVTGMVKPLRKYARGLIKYHQDIISSYNEIKLRYYKKTGGELRIGDKLHRLLVESYALTDIENKKANEKKITKTYRTATLDDYRIEFTIEFTITPTIGYKLTSLLGGKGVICSVRKASEMPRDSDGNVADIIMERDSVISRMNPGVLYEQFFGAVARDVTKDIKEIFGLGRNEFISLGRARELVGGSGALDRGVGHLLSLYELTSTEMFKYYSSCGGEIIKEHLAAVLNDGIYLYMPINSDLEYSVCVEEINKRFNLVYGPITFMRNDVLKTTKKNIRIGPVYLLLLEKVADDGSSVSSSKLSANGIITIPLRSDKFSSNIKNSAVRVLGESEQRIIVSSAKSELGALEIFDRNVSPSTHREVVKSILMADKPTDIKMCVDRSVNPVGGNRALLMVKSILTSLGIKITKK